MSAEQWTANPVARVFGPMRDFHQRLKSAVHRRRTVQSLRDLSDRQLMDIGIVRSDINRFVQGILPPFDP